MDNNRKDIGRAIRDKLEGMQQQPRAEGWDKLRAGLDQGKTKPGRLLWLWPLAVVIIAFTAGLTYFIGTENSESKNTIPSGNVETTVGGINNTTGKTDGNGSRTNDINARNDGSTDKVANAPDAGTKKSDGTTADSNNPGAGGAGANSTNAKSAKTVTDADVVNATPGTVTSKENSRNTTLGKVVTTSVKNSKAAQSKATYKNKTNPPIPDGTAAPGQVSAPKKGRGGSIATVGDVNNTLAYGPGKNGALTTGAAAAKERIAGLHESNVPNGGMAPGLVQPTLASGTRHTVAPAVLGKNVLAKPKKGTSGITLTKGNNVAAQTSADEVQAARDKARDSIATARDTLTAAEAGTLIASTATTIFTATLEGYDAAAVSQATESTAHELDEKIDSLMVSDEDTRKNSRSTYKRFYAFAYAAPNQFLYNSGRSLIDGRLNGLKTTTKTTVSYGAFAGYEATPHWGIRAGVLISRAERTTSGVVVDSLGEENYQGIKYIPGLNNNMLGGLFREQPFTIIQKTELFEVPVEVTYRMGGNKWSGKLIGGLSLVHVRTDNVSVQGGGYSFALGSLANTKQTGFTAGFGAGLYYEIVPSLQINIEPFIKYYINSFGKGSYQKTFNDSNPFSLSLRVGVQYNFNLWKKKK